jgi:hypothetical protein
LDPQDVELLARTAITSTRRANLFTSDSLFIFSSKHHLRVRHLPCAHLGVEFWRAVV